jgi:hypothetical protein
MKPCHACNGHGHILIRCAKIFQLCPDCLGSGIECEGMDDDDDPPIQRDEGTTHGFGGARGPGRLFE